MVEKENTFEPGTLIPRGIYIREFEYGSVTRSTEWFAEQADKERDLRLQMMEPTNWLSGFFAKEPDKEELQKFAGSLVAHLDKAGYDTAELDDWFMQHLM